MRSRFCEARLTDKEEFSHFILDDRRVIEELSLPAGEGTGLMTPF
jgi:hypothetical protein